MARCMFGAKPLPVPMADYSTYTYVNHTAPIDQTTYGVNLMKYAHIMFMWDEITFHG